MSDRAAMERLWYGQDILASVGRTVLAPAERLFGAVVGARDILYDAGWLPVREAPIPVVSVGNLTVGGTGKTPVAAWIAQGLAARGERPVMVLRGYGDDEPIVHEMLNPTIPVFVQPDRLGAARAAAARGATVAVLDDGFQHRRIQRVADIVLVSADRWTERVRLLPAGPWREPLGALRRATLIVVTRKAAGDLAVADVNERLARAAPAVPRVSVHLSPGELVHAAGGDGARLGTGANPGWGASGALTAGAGAGAGERAESGAPDQASEGGPERGVERTRPLAALRGARARAILSIADPWAFVRQLELQGASVEARIHPDHHAFTPRDVERALADRAADEVLICTLKDAVKLAPIWPRLGPTLWYVSQRVTVERGVGGLERVLDDLVRVRGTAPVVASD